ncbi:MAG TPA: dTMP kinase [Bacillota bacterium]
MLIAFEGIDRAGKSSVIADVKGLLAVSATVPIVACGEFESPISSTLRELVHKGCSPLLKTYLFAADRAWTYEHTCLPSLQKGAVVLWDRYVDSAIAYRSVEHARGSGLSPSFVRQVNNRFRPADLTILLDISAETSTQRARTAGKCEPYDEEFLRAVRAFYLREARKKRDKEYIIVDADRPRDSVARDVAQIIRGSFRGLLA